MFLWVQRFFSFLGRLLLYVYVAQRLDTEVRLWQ